MHKYVSKLDDVPEIKDYLDRIGAEVRSMRSAVVRINRGNYWEDLAAIFIDPTTGIITVTHTTNAERYSPTAEEAASIAAVIKNYRWPTIKQLPELVGNEWFLKGVDKEDIYLFRDTDNSIIMLQVRGIKKAKGREGEEEKAYRPWTFWSDDQWRCCEPDGQLPLYNKHLLRNNTIVFIHEGAKAAKRAQWMVESQTEDARKALREHPWGDELCNGVHVGWIGGALSPWRTDWSEIEKAGISTAIIIVDNDEPGSRATPRIAKQLNMPTFAIFFDSRWPHSFDLADPWPTTEAFYKRNHEDEQIYIGPRMRDMESVATWATDRIEVPVGKPVIVLREHFRDIWRWVVEMDMVVCISKPHIRLPADAFDGLMRSYAHKGAKVSRLVQEMTSDYVWRFAYKPGEKTITSDGPGRGKSFNVYVPSNLQPRNGDIEPFMEYMAYLVPDEAERNCLLKWIATLIACPKVHMSFGVLMISVSQGTGKTTLAEKILAPIIGEHNCSFPSDHSIMSNKNVWAANVRLAIMSELYAGASDRAYNALKSAITDKSITVDQKYLPQFTLENWVHVYASSNSIRAINFQGQADRRWFIPKVTEKPWPREKWVWLNKWIDAGGPSIVMHWAINQKKFYQTGEIAPITEMKETLQEDSILPADRAAMSIANKLRQRDEPAGITDEELRSMISAVDPKAQRSSLLHIKMSMNLKTASVANGRSTMMISMNDQLYSIYAAHPGSAKGSTVEARKALQDELAKYAVEYKSIVEPDL